jgi:hypothetical protein
MGAGTLTIPPPAIFLSIMTLNSMVVESDLFMELKQNKCVKGCGGCCYLVMPSYEELVEVEKNIEKLPPQYPGKEFFPYKMNLKIITVEHPDGRETYEPTACPFLYVADQEHRAIENFEIDSFENDITFWNKGKLNCEHRKVVHLKIQAPRDFAFLCGIHEEIRSNEMIGKLFNQCVKWEYRGRGSDSHYVCNRGILEYSRRIEAAQLK